MKKIIVIVIVLAFSLAGCRADEPAPFAAPPDVVQNQPYEHNEEFSLPPPFSLQLPNEFMEHLEGRELPIDGHPLLGAYETTSGCIMVLMANGIYLWQEDAEVPAVTGVYEVYRGTVNEEKGGLLLESDTGPLYTVIITFIDENAAMPGTIQVFDYYKKDVYRVTDLMNDIWFEATRIPD